MTFLWVTGQFALGTGTVPSAQGPPGKLCVCIQCLDCAHALECEWFGHNPWPEVQDPPEGGGLEEEVTATMLEMHCECIWQQAQQVHFFCFLPG